jgi:hypothetical protein
LQSLFGFHHGSNSAQITVTIKVGQHAAVGNYSLTLKGASGSLTLGASGIGCKLSVTRLVIGEQPERRDKATKAAAREPIITCPF